MFQRPKAQESDEDLLRLQEEFLKQSGQPSMTTKVSKRKPESNTDQCDREITNERKDVQISQMETGIDNSNITNKRVKFNDKDRKDETEKLKASSSTWIEGIISFRDVINMTVKVLSH